MAATVFWRKGNHVHYVDEIELPNADTEYMCQELKDRGWYDKGLRNIYPDASGRARATNAPGGKSDFTFIRQAGFEVNCNPANPRIKDRYNATNGKLKARDGTLSLTVEPKLKKLKRYLATYTHELKNKAEQKQMSHLLDAFSYPLAYLFPVDSETMRRIRLKGV